MSKISISLVTKVAWWVMPYVNAVEAFSTLTGLEPDYDKVLGMAMRGISIKVVDNT